MFPLIICFQKMFFVKKIGNSCISSYPYLSTMDTNSKCQMAIDIEANVIYLPIRKNKNYL